MKKYLLSLTILVGLFILHYWAMRGGYVRYPWLDIITHGIVCFGIAIGLGNFLDRNCKPLSFKKYVVLGVLIVGISWELLEIAYNITGHPLWSTEYYLDTFKDLIVDTIAGYLGSLVTNSRSKIQQLKFKI